MKLVGCCAIINQEEKSPNEQYTLLDMCVFIMLPIWILFKIRI